MTEVQTRPAVDLTEAVNLTGPLLGQSLSLKQRSENFWAAVVASRDSAAPNVIRAKFTELASNTGLTSDLERWGRSRGLKDHGKQTIEHLIRWALLGRCPFATRK